MTALMSLAFILYALLCACGVVYVARVLLRQGAR